MRRVRQGLGCAEVGLLMTYVRIDDEMHRNGKVRGVSLAARWSYLASICQSGNKLTDGFLADYDLSQVDADRKVVKELERAGLWEPVDGGWLVHDYLTYNRSRAQIEELSAQRRMAASKPRSKSLSKSFDKPSTDSSASRSANRDPYARSVLSDPLGSSSEIDPDTGEIRGSESSSDLPSNSLARPRRRLLDIDAVARLQVEFPAIDVTAAAADYLNWSGSAKHVDKVLGLTNQLKHPACAAKFPRASEEPYDARKSKFLAGPLAKMVVQTGVER